MSRLVSGWTRLAQETVGAQLVRALDGIGANPVEGDGRKSDPDSSRFFLYARSSAREARYWLLRAQERGLIAEVTSCAKMISGLLSFRGKSGEYLLKEDRTTYGESDWPYEMLSPI